jgi:NDP-mannose synthase
MVFYRLSCEVIAAVVGFQECWGASRPRAVILAGGKGVRLRPFTANFPKPLVPLGDTPILEVLLRRLITFGIIDITLALGHLAELIQAYFLTHTALTDKLNLSYVTEQVPTGTAGSLANVQGLDSTFLVINGDLLTNLDFNDLLRFHRDERATLTIAAHRKRIKIDLGVLKLDAYGRVIGYDEKPEITHVVSMGVYVYEPEVLDFIEKGEYLDFPDLTLKLIGAGRKVSAYLPDCIWLDIGRPEDYALAQEMFSSSPEVFQTRELPEVE